MTELVIASQLPADVNRKLQDRLPQARIVAVAPGTPTDIPPDATVLIGAPMLLKGRHASATPPAGWPWNLRWVQLMSSGIDAYPDWLFDLPVATARGSSAPAIAEFVFAAILAAAKQLPQTWISDHAQFDFAKRPRLASVRGATIGLVGFGAIGAQVARLGLALGARVVAVRHSDQPFEVAGVERAADLPSLFSRSDHVVIAAPLTPATRHLVNADVLAAAKPGLHLVNIARGGLVDTPALAAALEDGRVGLASLDVTEPEPLPPGHAFYTHPRVRLSPHISSSSPDLFDRVIDIFVRNLEARDAGHPLINLVDLKGTTR